MGVFTNKVGAVGSKISGTRSHDLTQELYRKNVELAHTNQTLSLLRTIDNLVLETENSLGDLTQGITGALVGDSTYLFSAIFMRERTESVGAFTPGGFSVTADRSAKAPSIDAIKDIKLYPDRPWFASKDHSEVIDLRSLDREILRTLFKENAARAEAIMVALDGSTVCLVKLLAQKHLVGVLMVGLPTPAAELNIKELEFLGRIGEAIGIAIDNKLLFEENQQVLKKLKESNEKLKALDEAKDEFISMASHQLRTPLTAVKGYVSMVIEGDAGPIPKAQKDLLEQAFASSQRMVYLIADLLNVSRLKTGKFVIESTPTHLPEVVESEIGQLVETAKVHNIELTYKKPENFPTINLDETKTRQVIMNFIDNAIYYTPAGGHINVELSSTDKSVEFKVVDDGLGVPKSEQPHLFTKFFRAGNAKKARPDGTGLGLFMAKKVIVAQGGALLFKSEEGKGSTFGFSFPLNRPEVNAPTAEKEPENA